MNKQLNTKTLREANDGTTVVIRSEMLPKSVWAKRGETWSAGPAYRTLTDREVATMVRKFSKRNDASVVVNFAA